MELARQEKCEFLPFVSPKEVHLDGDRIVAISFVRTERQLDDTWVEDPDQTVRIRADFVTFTYVPDCIRLQIFSSLRSL